MKHSIGQVLTQTTVTSNQLDSAIAGISNIKSAISSAEAKMNAILNKHNARIPSTELPENDLKEWNEQYKHIVYLHGFLLTITSALTSVEYYLKSNNL